jgi:hypothetical protein
MLKYNNNLLKELGIHTNPTIGYWWIDSSTPKDRRFIWDESGWIETLLTNISVWNGFIKTFLTYEGSLPLEQVITKLNSATKEIVRITTLGKTEEEEHENIYVSINRIASAHNLGIGAAQAYAQTWPRECILINNGPFKDHCYIKDKDLYLPKEVLNVIPFKIKGS